MKTPAVYGNLSGPSCLRPKAPTGASYKSSCKRLDSDSNNATSPPSAMSTATEIAGTDGLRQRPNGNGKVITLSEEGKKTDRLLDSHTEYVLLPAISVTRSNTILGMNLVAHGVCWRL